MPKSLDEISVRRVFARFGKVSSMKLVNKPTFSTNVAYVGYFVHSQAARAMKFACMEPELRTSTFEPTEESSTPVAVVRPRIKLEGAVKE